MFGPYGFPPYFYGGMPPNNERGPEDPFKTMKKWRKFLKAEEGEDKKKKEEQKKKDEEKKTNPKDVFKLASILVLTMPITGPLYLLTMAMMWHFVRVSFQ